MENQTFSHSDALLDPRKFYATPKEAANDGRFSVTERREILEAWQENEESLLRASNEGLDGGERPDLQHVIEELQHLF